MMKEEAASIQVLNGSATEGLAGKTQEYLLAQGASSVTTGNAGELLTNCKIIDYTGKPYTRRYLVVDGYAALADALEKLEDGVQDAPYNRTPAMAHLFIVNPLSGGGVLRLFSTHPPLEQRIRRLRAMAVR